MICLDGVSAAESREMSSFLKDAMAALKVGNSLAGMGSTGMDLMLSGLTSAPFSFMR